MKPHRCLLLLLAMAVWCFCSGAAAEEEAAAGGGKSFRLPRWLRIFSRGPNPEDERYEGKEIVNHVDNVMRGGSIGLEVNLKKQVGGKLSKWWDRVKRHFLPTLKRRFRKSEREFEHFPAVGAGIDPRKKPPPFRLSDRLEEWEPHAHSP